MRRLKVAESFVGLFLAGCAPDVPSWEAYTTPGQCSELRDVDLRWECLTLSAWERARKGEVEPAAAQCEEIRSPIWRDECVFLVVDGAELLGDAAVELCDGAGQFSQRCRGHAFQRAAKGALNMEPVEGIQRQLVGLVEMATDYGVERPWWRAHRILIQHLAHQNVGFSTSRCGDLQESSCEAVMAEVIRKETDPLGIEQWRSLCPPPVSAELAQQFGMPSWSPTDDTVIQGAWLQICHEFRHPVNPPR